MNPYQKKQYIQRKKIRRKKRRIRFLCQMAVLLTALFFTVKIFRSVVISELFAEKPSFPQSTVQRFAIGKTLVGQIPNEDCFLPIKDPAITDSETAGDFSGCLFIGDSRTQGFMLYANPKGADAFTSKGLMVSTAMTKKIVKKGNRAITIPEALDQAKYDKVYIMLGINELGWAYSDIFIKKYADLIDMLKTKQPDAKIYIQSILPVTEKKSQSDKIFNNENIRRRNLLLKNLSKSKDVVYVNASSALADKNGNLPADAASDGIHLTKAYCQKWADYLKKSTLQNS